MIEFLFELVLSGLFELFTEISAAIYNRRNGVVVASEPVVTPPDNRSQSHSVSTFKFLLGATAGAFWATTWVRRATWAGR